MKAVLTDRTLKALKPAPAGKRVTVWDAAVPSFGVRVTDKGKVSFFVMRRRAGEKRPTRVLIGAYPFTTLADARKKAGDALKSLATGEHPREVEARQQRAKAEAEANTFRAVAEKFITQHTTTLRTGGEVEKAIRRELISMWGDRPISDISRRDVIELVENIAKRGTAYAARNTLAYANKLWNWTIARGITETSPCDRVRAKDFVGSPKARDRTLTDAELRTIWHATEGEDYPLNPFIRLLLITGARRSELAKMRSDGDEIDLDAGLWRLSSDRTKNQERRVLPLPRLAVDILRSLPEQEGAFIFSTTEGDKPISGFAKLKGRLDKRTKGLAPWRLHDLRRTMRTGLSALQISPLVAELAIGHRQRGVVAVYDQHRYEAELRDALEKWCARLRSIVEPAPDNVISLPARA